MEVIPLIVLVVSGWYWWDTMRCKEIARNAGKSVCQQNQVQFLDDTVEKKKIWLRRNSAGRLELCRLYIFEFTSDGSQRSKGRIVLAGQFVADINMDAYRINTDSEKCNE